MRILSLGLDRSVLDQNSKTAKRVAEYKNLVEKYIVLVPEQRFKPLALFDLYRRSRNIIEKENIDLITVQDQYFIGLLGYLLARKYKIGLNVQVHGFEKFFGIRKLIAKFLIPRANSIRVVSQRLKNFLIEEFDIEKEKITVVPIYVEISNVVSQVSAPCHSREACPRATSGSRNLVSMVKNNDKFVFLTVSRLVPIKNISLQIEAMKEVVKKYPQVKLWIVGDGPERDNLMRQVSGSKLQDWVKFFGWQDNVEYYYNQADAFLLTSNSEGWGMAVIEAASYGLPIIMTNVGLVEEVIVDNESGLIIPVSDKQGLIRAMFKLIEDKDLRLKLSGGAIEAVKKLPKKEEVLKLYKESWQKALK